MSLNDVIQYLGIPDGFTTSEFNINQLFQTRIGLNVPASTIFYGCIELMFERISDKLIYIKIMVAEQRERNKDRFLQLPSALRGDWINLMSTMRSIDMMEFMKSNSIEWIEVYTTDSSSIWRVKDVTFSSVHDSMLDIVIDNDEIYFMLLRLSI